ncbi:MAG: acyl transferase [Salibacteraceae bacterium]
MKSIFSIANENEFLEACFKTFNYQYKNNVVYKRYIDLTGRPKHPKTLKDLTFLPVELFKHEKIISGEFEPEITFTSSSTTGTGVSNHYIKDINTYEKSFRTAFEKFYGSPEEYLTLALLPSYLERDGSSLIYMANDFISRSKYEQSDFFLDDFSALKKTLIWAIENNVPTLLLGVTFGLLDFAETHSLPLRNTIVMETGGMKGRKKEITREAVHSILKKSFSVDCIHSEYGMTELLSQAYSKGNGLFKCPEWMRVMIRDTSDPFQIIDTNKTGGINVIDLANIDSCSFIATQDLGRLNGKNEFEVLGRFDNSDVRGCNLLVV